MMLFALLVQPLIGPAFGREWSGVELFGIAPDPTVLATLGVLLAADRVCDFREILAVSTDGVQEGESSGFPKSFGFPSERRSGSG